MVNLDAVSHILGWNSKRSKGESVFKVSMIAYSEGLDPKFGHQQE